MRKLWCNARECTQSELKEHAEDISDLESFEVMLREAARKSYPENVDNPVIAPRDYEVLQSGRVLELQNTDLWIRPTDLSWHVPILVTIRELLSKIIVDSQLRIWKTGVRPRSKRLRKTKRSDQTYRVTT